MTHPCQHRFPSGEFCRRRTKSPSGFCHFHEGIPRPEDVAAARKGQPTPAPELPELAHLEQLDSYDDIYMTVREALHAVCTGQIPPSRAYAVGYLVDLWMKVREKRAVDKSERKVFRPKLQDPDSFQEIIYRQVADAVWEQMLGKGNTPQTVMNLNHVDSIGTPVDDMPHQYSEFSEEEILRRQREAREEIKRYSQPIATRPPLTPQDAVPAQTAPKPAPPEKVESPTKEKSAGAA